MGQGFVEIHPRELQFTFELKKQSSCSVHLVNKSNEYVAFKVKTTSPKRYCVRPNTGVILPRATCDFTVTMQAQRTAPPDMQLKDKFLVQTTAVPPGTTDDDLIPAFFSKETNGYIEENKLRVVLVSPSHSPAEQPINGGPNTDAAAEVPVLKEALNVGDEMPALEKEIPSHVEQISATVNGIPSLVKGAPILRPSPVKEIPIRTPSPVKETPILTPFPVKETPISSEGPVLLHEAPAVSTNSPPPLKDASAIIIEKLPPKESTAISQESALEETVPREAVTLTERGLFNVQNHQLSHVTEDVQNLKSKLNNLESKLEEAEKMIIKLREESRTTTQERDRLQQDMVFLRKKGTPKSQVGFPLLFVVYVALVGTSLGYLLRL